MKIGIIGPAHPLRGGLADFNERFARELQAAGHEVIIYSYSLQYPGFLFPGKTQYTEAPPPANLRIRTIINSINPFSWLRAGAMLKNDRNDLLFVRYWLPFMGPALGSILRIAKRNRHTRVVAITDNILPHESRPGDRMFTKYFVGAADAFVTMSATVLKDVRSLTPKPAIQLHHPLYDNYGAALPMPAARQKLNLRPDGKYLLFFGFIRRYKGLDMLLEAMADERVKAQNIQLIVAGEFYDKPGSYLELIGKHGLESHVHLHTDFIPNDTVAQYFSAADAVVLPYRSATQSGITQIATHFLKPVIATRVGGLPEIVKEGQTGLLCNANPEGIADGILQFYSAGALPRSAEALAIEKAALGWKPFVEKLVAFAEHDCQDGQD